MAELVQMTHPPAATVHRDERLRKVRQGLSAAAATRSVAKGVGLIAGAGAVYLATWAAIFLSDSWLLKLPLGYANGIAIGMLFLIGHDACHQSLTPLGWLNRLLGRIAFLPALHPYTAWELSHNGLHHSFTNLKDRDPGYAPFSKDEFDRLPLWRRGLEHVYRTFLGLALFYLIENWLKLEMFPRAEHQARMRSNRLFRFDRACVLVFGAIMIGASAWLGVLTRPAGQAAWLAGAAHVAVAWVLPFLVWNGMISFITFQQHTHPQVRWFDNEDDWSFYESQIRGTVHIEFPWFMRILLHNINEHTAHHINPRVPLYELKQAQDEVRRILEDDVVVLIWTPSMTHDTLRRCKLYDYRNLCWLDFAGRPTGASLKTGTPSAIRQPVISRGDTGPVPVLH
jgi:omega-6 fatty acid desaturase (delta-12 desaturase)